MFDAGKNRMIGLPYCEKTDNIFSRFDTIPACYGQTDIPDRIVISISRVSVLTRDKNLTTTN